VCSNMASSRPIVAASEGEIDSIFSGIKAIAITLSEMIG